MIRLRRLLADGPGRGACPRAVAVPDRAAPLPEADGLSAGPEAGRASAHEGDPADAAGQAAVLGVAELYRELCRRRGERRDTPSWKGPN
jgi:hypothetical protein